MATLPEGKPSGTQQPFKLNVHQKRQATLLYHWMSLDYLKGLKALIDTLIKGADVNLELANRQGRDALIANERWGVRDTAANWSTHVFPALQDFRKATIKDIALRATESFDFTGANQCGRMIQEFSSMWMTPDEEERFTKQWEQVYRYAWKVDAAAGVGGNRHQLDDHSMVIEWREHSQLFVRLPLFRVRTDVEGVSGKKPPRTGVYVPQDDEFGTLQFAWTGNGDGVLGDVQTFNDLGDRLVAEVGRSSLWIDDAKLIPFALREMEKNPQMDTGMSTLESVRRNPARARTAMTNAVFTKRPCKWYFVEKVEDQFDVDTHDVAETATPIARLRCEAGQPCPREGFWSTPARANSRRRFEVGEVMPAFASDYGATIWEWDEG